MANDDNTIFMTKITVEYSDGSSEEYEDESFFLVVVNDETNSYDIIPTEDVGEEILMDFSNDIIEMFENVFVFEPESHLKLVVNNVD